MSSSTKYSQNFTLIENMKKFINIIDNLRDVGLDKIIQLPRIVVLGTQSSGKSSLLESIVGLDFLPRGSGVVTRRPLELRMINVIEKQAPEPYAIFEEVKDKKFTNFDQVREQINALTDKVAGANKGIVDNPIILTIYSATCPDLTIVDLPGITRIPMSGSDQTQDIEKVTKDMARRYCQDLRTIILCVIPANQDLSTSDSLQMARQLDPNGDRTLGVFTKIDLMDRGTDARKLILGQEIELKLGYVGVRLRSQEDINNNKRVTEAILEEKSYFSKHPVYSTIPSGSLGIENLTSKLSKLLFKHIHNFLPTIMREIQNKLDECQNRLHQLGQPLPQTDNEKFHILYDLVNKFSESFKSSIGGKYELSKNKNLSKNYLDNLSDAAKIRSRFKDVFINIIEDEKNFGTKRYSDEQIFSAIKYYEGDNLSGFQSIDAFNYLLQPLLEELKEPAIDCVNDIFAILEKLSQNQIAIQCERFPFIQGELQEMIINYLEKVRDITKGMVNDYLNCEIGYVHTDDVSFQKSYLDNQIKDQQDPKKREELQKQLQNIDQKKAKQILINEFRHKVDTYYQVVIRGIRDTIPKIIGNFFVKAAQKNIQMYLLEELQKNDELKKSFQEPEYITEERERNYRLVSILKNAQKVIKRDPELSEYLSRNYENKMKNQSVEQPPQESNDQKINQVQQTQTNSMSNQSNQYFPPLKQVETQQQVINSSLFGDFIPNSNNQPQKPIGSQQNPSQQQNSLIKERSIQTPQQSTSNPNPLLQQQTQQQSIGQKVEQQFDKTVDSAVGNAMSNKQFQQQVGNQVSGQVAKQMGLGDNNPIANFAGQSVQKAMDNKNVQQQVSNQVKNQAKEGIKEQTKPANKTLFGLF